MDQEDLEKFQAEQKEFENWIESLRKEKTIRNDDTTLVSIQMPPES